MDLEPKGVRRHPKSLLPGFGSKPSAVIDDVIASVRRASNSGRLDVRGTMGLTDAVTKFDQLTFRDQSHLMLETVTADYIALAVKEVILDVNNPRYLAYMSRIVGQEEEEILASLNGANAKPDPAKNGKNGTGETHGNGNHGLRGVDGRSGDDGRFYTFPPIFLFFQELKFSVVGTPKRQYFQLFFRGVRGGDGGKGAGGGRGGSGDGGKKGSVRGVPPFLYCAAGAGRGGNGGPGGQGGRGGNGAQGGPGCGVFLFAPDTSIFDFTTTDIEGGEGGRGGDPGAPGQGGNPGKGGGPNIPCESGKRGTRGALPSPPSLGPGTDGLPGPRGRLFLESRDNADLFG